MFKIPKVGDTIYVPDQWYMSHGVDDFAGGKAKVKKVTGTINAGKRVHVIEIEERPGHGYYWENSIGQEGEQERLKKEYKNQKAHPDPDNHPDSNRWD